ncbi:trigger factor [bacterium]|nr:trigger factor [bacterium]
MKILNSQKQGNVIFLELEQPFDVLTHTLDSAFKKIVKDVRIPGFRQGKITRSMYEKYFGKEPIIREGVMEAVNAAYTEAVQLLDLHVIDFPRNIKIGEFKENEALQFSCEVDVLPEAKLGTYKGLDITVAKDQVSDDSVNDQLERLRDSYAPYETTDRAAQSDDVIRASLTAIIDGEPYAPWTRDGAGIRIGMGNFGSEFDSQLLGASAGDTKTFSTTLPDDFSNKDTAGKLVEFTVTVQEVREKRLPELTDEFAAKVSPQSTVEALRSETRQRLESQATEKYENDLQNAIINAIIDGTEIEVQPILVNREIDQLVAEFESNVRRIGYTLDQYLAATQGSLEQLRDTYAEAATRRVKADIILAEIAKTESIDVTDDQLVAEIKSWQSPELTTDKQIEKYLKKIDRSRLKYNLRRQRTVEFLIANTTITH